MLSNWFHSHNWSGLPIPTCARITFTFCGSFLQITMSELLWFSAMSTRVDTLIFHFQGIFLKLSITPTQLYATFFWGVMWCRAWLKSFRSGTYKNFIGVLLDFNNYHTSKPMSPCENILRITRLWKGGCSSLKGSPLNDNKIPICYGNNPLSLIL